MTGGTHNLKMYTFQEVMQITGLTKGALYYQASKGYFPKGVRFAPRVQRWVAADVEKWMSNKLRERKGNGTSKEKAPVKPPSPKPLPLPPKFKRPKSGVAYIVLGSTRNGDYINQPLFLRKGILERSNAGYFKGFPSYTTAIETVTATEVEMSARGAESPWDIVEFQVVPFMDCVKRQ